MQSGIYSLHFKSFPEFIYIGSAVNIRKRYQLHISLLRSRKHPNTILQNFANKYGYDTIQLTTVEICPVSDLLSREQFFIDSLQPFFNICKVAGNRLGTKQSIGTRLKISKSSKRKTRYSLSFSGGRRFFIQTL
jgi:group I intron endonuclease